MVRKSKNDVFIVGEPHKDDETFTKLSEFPEINSWTYEQIFSARTRIASDATVFLCFPYSLWDNFVEHKDRLYGVGEFGDAIRNLAQLIAATTDICFPGARFVNGPMSIAVERDKLLTKQTLAKNGIEVAVDINKSVDAILAEVENGNGVYVKVRYGSLGKGITYIGQQWTTNFKYDGKTISNHDDDYSWKQIDITGDVGFLKRILEEDVVVERAVQNPWTDSLRFDLRAYCVFGTAERHFAEGRMTDRSMITNLAQGAQLVSLEELARFVPKHRLCEGIDIIRQSSYILGFKYAGGDIIFEGREYKPIFLEINSFSGASTAIDFFQSVYNALLRDASGEYEMSNSQSRDEVFTPA